MQRNLHDAILPFYYFAKCCGFIPVTLTDNNFVAKRRDVVFSLVWLAIFITVFSVLAFRIKQEESEDVNYISQIGGWFEFYATIAIVVVSILSAIFTRNQFIQCFQIFANIDQFLVNVNQDIIYRNFYIYFPLVFCVVEYLEVTIMDYVFFMQGESVVDLASNYITILTNSAVRFAFASMVLLISQRLSSLNLHMRNLYKDITSQNGCVVITFKIYQENISELSRKKISSNAVSTVTYSEENELLHSVIAGVDIFNQLCVTTKFTNYCCSLNILMCFALAFFITLNQLYTCYVIVAHSVTNHIRELCSSLNWVLFQIFEAVFITNICANTEYQAKEFSTLLHKIGYKTDSKKIKQTISILSMQSFHQTIKFSACGFFNLDFSLLYSIIGAVTTYLVFMIQFDNN